MMEKIKSFYHRRRDWVWLVIAILVVLFATGNVPNPITQKSMVDSFDGKGLAVADMAMNESVGRGGGGMPMNDYIEPGFVPDQEEKIRKNASLNLEVEKSDYSDTKLAIDKLMTEHKGFYTYKNESVHTRNQADYYTYRINIKFDKDNFDTIIEEFRILGDVKYFSIDASDLTAQYYDVASYKEAAEQVKSRVQALLARATEIDDIISIETKLASLQRQIDGYQKQLTNLDRQTEYSQLSLTVSEKMGYVQSFYEMTKLRDLFRNIVQSIDRLFVQFSKLFGYLIVIVVIWGIYRGVKKVRFRKRRNLE
jgi:hypothetical protein